MLKVKKQTVINCLQLSDTKTRSKNDVISEKLVHCCIFIVGKYAKLDRMKTIGTRRKINTI